MSLISNAYRTISLSDPAIASTVEEIHESELDPLELLIELEDHAQMLWQVTRPDQSRESFVASYVSSAINDL